ncbi:MAG: CHAD domain-containing protein [Spirulinaceae cyanobacterium SM2_1_0]|nr:CHAD domain-containing protein [Spirulinaceae cyanobacterium SM2_1_0]
MITSVKQLQNQAAAEVSLGDWATAAIAKHTGKFRKYPAAVLADHDPEDLHQMRVGLRRLRAALRGFAPALRLPKAASEQRVGKLARCLGELRDLDVLGAALRDRHLPELPPTEQSAARPALQALQEQRRRAFKRVKRALTGKLYCQLESSFTAWLEQPQYQPLAQVPVEPVLPDLLLPDLSDLLLQPAWLVGTVQTADGIQVTTTSEAAVIDRLLNEQAEPLHSLRKTAKRVRYQMELFAPGYGEPYQRAVEQVKAIQTVLGEVQDSAVLGEFLVLALGANWGDRLPTLAARLQTTRQRKWQEWQALQRQFLDPDTRHALRATVLPQPPAPAVVEDAEPDPSADAPETES